MRYVIRERFFAIGEDSDITDVQGDTVYQVDGKVLTLRGTLIVRDAQGNEVAKVERKLLSLVPTYEITLGGQEAAEVRKKFFTPFHPEFIITIPGSEDLRMAGDFFQHEFTISRGDQTVATVSRAWVSLTATYGVDTMPGENDLLLLACVLALDLAIDRERN
jgi:uncharacterized protein YxjI